MPSIFMCLNAGDSFFNLQMTFSLVWTCIFFPLFLLNSLQPGIKVLHNSMGSQHLDYNRLPLKYKTMTKVRGITMKYNQDNGKQMVSLVPKLSTTTFQSFLTMHTGLLWILHRQEFETLDDHAWPLISPNLFPIQTIFCNNSCCEFAVVKSAVAFRHCITRLPWWLKWKE